MKTPKFITIVLLVFLMFVTSYVPAHSTSGLGELVDALTFFAWINAITVALILLWLAIHIWPKRSTRGVLFFRILVDTTLIIFSSAMICIWSSLLHYPFVEGYGGGLWHALDQKYYWFSIYKIILLIILITSLVYILNKWITSFSRVTRIFVHFFLCLFITLGLLTLFQPTIAGPVTRWFIDSEVLFYKYGDPYHYSRTSWSRYYGFETELIEFRKFERRLYSYSVPVKEQPLSDKSLQWSKDHVSDFLILEDIGEYKLSFETMDLILLRTKKGPGYVVKSSSGYLLPSHCIIDHQDITFTATYFNPKDHRLWVKVDVTKHQGGDSDRWLANELESAFWGAQGISLRNIDGNHIFIKEETEYSTTSEKNVTVLTLYKKIEYGWLSGNIVVRFQYHQYEKEYGPPQLLSKYLKKHPSTISLTVEDASSKYHERQYLHDKMKRQLWLGNKWRSQAENGVIEADEGMALMVKQMFLFLNTREKVLGIKAEKEKMKLWKLLESKDKDSITNILSAYQEELSKS